MERKAPAEPLPADDDRTRAEEAAIERANRERFRNRVRWGVCALLAVVAGFTAVDLIEGGNAWPVVGILLLVGVLALVPVRDKPWQELRSSLKSASVGPVSFELYDAVLRVAPDKAQAGEADHEEAPDSVIKLRLTLEYKLAYIAKKMLPDYEPGHKAFATIGSLWHDQYLPYEEATIAAEILTLRTTDLEGLPTADRTKFLNAAGTLVDNLLALVLNRLTRKHLEDGLGRKVTSIRRSPRDLLQVSDGDQTSTILTVFTHRAQGKALEQATANLRKENERHARLGQLIIVVPDTATDVREGPDGDILVTRLENLGKLLPDAAPRARRDPD